MCKTFNEVTVYLTEREKCSKMKNNTKTQETNSNNHKNKNKTENFTKK